MLWTTDAVLIRLIEAYGTIEIITGRVRPKQYGSSLPEMMFDPNDQDLKKYTGQNLDDLEKIRREAADQRTLVGASSVSLAENAQLWPIEFVADEDKRECIIEYATCRSRDGDWSKYVQRRNRRLPQKKAWIRRTTYRWNEKSLQLIAEKLNNAGPVLSETERCQMSHDSRTREFIDDAEERVTHWRSADAEPRSLAEMDYPATFTIPKPKRARRRKPVTAD